MSKVTVLQKGNDRYTFRAGSISYDPNAPEIYSVTREHLMTTGSSEYTEITTKDKGNALYKKLIADGFHRFRSYKDVSWYATCENNTPYEEVWKTEGIYLIPVVSRILDIQRGEFK